MTENLHMDMTGPDYPLDNHVRELKILPPTSFADGNPKECGLRLDNAPND